MSINGAGFLLFLLAALIVYYLAPRRRRWVVLLIASGVFYLSYEPAAAVYLALTTAATWLFALWLDALAARRPEGETREERQKQKKRLTRRRRQVLAAALALDFACLLVLKYSGFFAGLTNSLLGTGLPIPSFLLPLGISFYVFQTAGYLIDVYRGRYRAQRNVARYALFVCFFPQMVQGPINRYDRMEKQLFEGNCFDWGNIQHGFYRILFGVLKKALIADPLSAVVGEIYGSYASYPGVVAFLGAALYCLQLYCDFSGGIDVVRGAARLFGVEMAENFRQPYFVSSLADFWRRWHISLGEWMKDYLFFPLALSKGFNRLAKAARRRLPPELAKRVTPCAATFLVFLAVGMWQGPGLSNIAYGLWNGFWMSLGVLWVPAGARLDARFSYRRHKGLMLVLGVLRTNLLVIIGRYFSNASSLRSALGMLKHTVADPGFSRLSASLFAGLGLDGGLLIPLCAAAAVLLAVSAAREKGIDVVEWLGAHRWYVQFAVLFMGLLLAVFCVYGNSSYTPIAYVYENV